MVGRADHDTEVRPVVKWNTGGDGQRETPAHGPLNEREDTTVLYDVVYRRGDGRVFSRGKEARRGARGETATTRRYATPCADCQASAPKALPWAKERGWEDRVTSPPPTSPCFQADLSTGTQKHPSVSVDCSLKFPSAG